MCYSGRDIDRDGSGDEGWEEEELDPEDYDRGDDYNDPDSDDWLIDGVGFADPGGRSALRAATKGNPRDQPCPTYGSPNRLTRIDVARGYQCDSCADAAEGRGGY